MTVNENLIDQLLLSNFIHQVVNPLNGVLGTLDNLIDGTISDLSSREQRLKAVRGQISHSIEIIRNLAFLSELSSDTTLDNLKSKAGRIVLPKLIIDAAQFFQEAGHTKKIRIKLMDRDTQYIVFGHQNLLKQVFINIFDNGIKYGSAGSEISVQCMPQKSGNQLAVEIKNIGVGFESHERTDIFELGIRGDAAKQKKASGSGIGLYICKRIIELAHGGIIEASHSNKRNETTFRIVFPKFIIEESFYDKAKR